MLRFHRMSPALPIHRDSHHRLATLQPSPTPSLADYHIHNKSLVLFFSPHLFPLSTDSLSRPRVGAPTRQPNSTWCNIDGRTLLVTAFSLCFSLQLTPS